MGLAEHGLETLAGQQKILERVGHFRNICCCARFREVATALVGASQIVDILQKKAKQSTVQGFFMEGGREVGAEWCMKKT